MENTIEARIIEIEYPGGKKRYKGQLNHKQTLVEGWSLDNWVDVTKAYGSKKRAREVLERKKFQWEYNNNKKETVVETL